jgi:hypothetical protein
LGFLSGRPAGPDVVSVSNFGQRVTLKAMLPGTCVLMIGGQIGLTVQVGQFENHTGMEHDLIAQARLWARRGPTRPIQ